MKLKAIMGCLMAAAMGMSSAVYAAGDYFPPERMHCHIDAANKLSCDGFERAYLTEDASNVNIPRGKDETFFFVSGSAYFTPSKDEASVFFTYKNTRFKTVKLKTASTAIRPDFENGSWKQLSKDIYTCNAGYMHCPITNLPNMRK